MLAEEAEVDSSEGRTRALQRVAFGVDATEDERAQALAELAALRSDPERPGMPDADAADAPDATAASVAAAPVAATGPESTGAGDAGRKRLVRWTVAAAAAGVVAGGLFGWFAASVRAGSEAPSADPLATSSDPGLPLEDTELLAVFDRLPPAAESARVADLEDAIDPASVRLLATRVDGPTAFLARTAEGDDVCLVILLPDGTARSECTAEGRLPSDGLRISYGAYGYGLAAAQLDATGIVSLGLVISY